jgi:hemolysin activation/secretion protein
VTSRVSVGPQSLSAGRIVFQLHTGRVSEVRLVNADDKTADTRWGTWINAFPTSAGRRLDARDLEQGVEQMKRLPSQTVVTTLTPGLEPDTSVLTIERQTGALRDRLRGGITLDNSGSPALGRTQLSANLAFDNPLGLNDIAGLSFNGNAENAQADHRSQSGSFSYSVPLGYSLFSANLSHSRFAQFIQLTTTRALSSGDSASVDFRWDHVALRTASTKTGVWLDLSTRKARSYLDDTELLVQRRQTTSFEAGANFKALFANGASLDFSVGHRRGLPWLDAEDDLPASAGGLTLRPSLWTGNVGASLPFSLPQGDQAPGAASPRSWQYSANLHAQTTSDRTTAIDQIAIGNRSSVRGFDGDAVLLAESGWTLRNELSTPLHAGPVDATVYAGLDYGRVWGPSSADLPGHNLAGAALGLRGRWKAFQADLALAAPLVKPEGFKTASVDAYLSITCAF